MFHSKRNQFLKFSLIFLVLFLIIVAILVGSLYQLEYPKTSKTTTEVSSLSPGHWLSDLERAKQAAEVQQKTVMIDLYADWCEPCVKFEKLTFKDPTVQKELEMLIKVRLDFNLIDPIEEEISSKYNILGLPTILFINSDGQELEGTRIEGFLNPNEFLLHLKDKVYKKLG